jgi:hypothetical protein
MAPPLDRSSIDDYTAAASGRTRIMREPVIVYEDVEVLEHDGSGFTCRIGGRTVFVGKYVPVDGTTVGYRGDRGTLTIPRSFAEEQKLPLGRNMTDDEIEAWTATARLRVAGAREVAARAHDDAEARAALRCAEDELAAALSIRCGR